MKQDKFFKRNSRRIFPSKNIIQPTRLNNQESRINNKPKLMNIIRFHVGNFLMIAGIALFASVYYPVVMMYLFPGRLDNSVVTHGFYIQIPSISAQAKVIPNVDPWNEAEYDQALQQGVAQAKGTAMPGQTGTMFLFAHSMQNPWQITRENIPFLKLGDVKQNEAIYVYWNGKRYIYKVTNKKEVWPNEVEYLTKNQGNVLILQTCTPIGTSFKRLLVFAKPV